MGTHLRKKKGVILKIICFTGSRSEYYLLRPLFIELKERKKYELFLIVSGGILQEKNKQTLRDIKKDQITISELKLY